MGIRAANDIRDFNARDNIVEVSCCPVEGTYADNRLSNRTANKQQQQMLQEQPLLNEKVEALFASYLQTVDAQHEVMALKRQMLTTPALPDDGY